MRMRIYPVAVRAIYLAATFGCFSWALLWSAIGFALDGPGVYLKKPDAWFAGAEAKGVADNILSYQSTLGGWPKNVDTTAGRYSGAAADLHPTFDNRATMDEMRFLARMFNATHDEKYRAAFNAGFQYILTAQYPNGGWPQSYPLSTKYHRHITFNDDAMVQVIRMLQEIVDSPVYEFVEPARRKAARAAFDRGITCILKCQIRVNGKLTAWCAQHDEVNFSPAKARWHELPSISGAESVGIVRLLMSVENPSPKVVESIESAVAWFESAKISGYRVVQHEDEQTPGKFREAVRDAAAPPLWARMYDISTGQPLVSGMDSVPHLGMQEIGFGRPHYAWFGPWPSKLLQVEFPRWQQRLAKAGSKS
jgi:PelA/Pel-15E family pectate lyase